MSLWYDKYDKEFASKGRSSWIKFYAEYLFNKVKTELLSAIDAHTNGENGRHSAGDIILSDGRNAESALKSCELSAEKLSETLAENVTELEVNIADNTWNAEGVLKYKGVIGLSSDTYTAAKLEEMNEELFDTLEDPADNGAYLYRVKTPSNGVIWGTLLDIANPFTGEDVEAAEEKESKPTTSGILNPTITPGTGGEILGSTSNYVRLQRLELMTSLESEKKRVFVRKYEKTTYSDESATTEYKWEEWSKAEAELASKTYVDNKSIIRDKAVTTAKLKDAAVTTAKIADKAVTADKLADNALDSAKSYADTAKSEAKTYTDTAKSEAKAYTDDEVKALKRKSIPHTTAEGQSVSITDQLADEEPISLKIYGSADGVGDIDSESGKYKISVVSRGKNVLKIIDGYGVYGGGLTTTRVDKIAGAAVAIGRVIPNSAYIFTSSNTTDVGRYFFYENHPIDKHETSLSGSYYGAQSKVKLTVPENANYIAFRVRSGTDAPELENPQLETGTVATDYEPYTETTAVAELDTALGENEYIDIIEKKRCADDAETADITVYGELKTADSSENVIECQTDIQPSNMSVEYYQDVNKVITELTNAILSMGGNV